MVIIDVIIGILALGFVYALVKTFPEFRRYLRMRRM